VFCTLYYSPVAVWLTARQVHVKSKVDAFLTIAHAKYERINICAAVVKYLLKK